MDMEKINYFAVPGLTRTVRDRPLSQFTIDHIQTKVAEFYKISKGEMLSRSRFKKINEARSVAIYLCRRLTDYTITKIAVEFNRHHSTVIHQSDQVQNWVDTEQKFAKMVQDIQDSCI